MDTSETISIKPRKRRLLRKFFLTLFVIGVPIVLALGYLGFVPVVSDFFGSNKPRDLGIRPSDADLQSALAKTGIQYSGISSARPESSFSFSGSRHLDTRFTDRELTAIMAHHEKMWKHYPVSDAQVRFNPDGTAELSGILRTDRLRNYAADSRVAVGQVESLLDAVKAVVSDPPIYLKGRAAVREGILSTDFERVEIGRLPVPTKFVARYEAALGRLSQESLKAAGTSVQSASVSSGQASFKGTVPETIRFAAQ